MTNLDRDYLLSREQHARGMADRAQDKQSRKIHTALADSYAQRAKNDSLESAE